MRIFITTFIDAPEDSDVQTAIDDAADGVTNNIVRLNTLPEASYQLLDNLQYSFSDNSDEEGAYNG